MVPNILANIPESLMDVGIGIAEHMKTNGMQISIPTPVCLHSIRMIVLRTVQLNYKICFCNIKVDNICADHFLPVYHNRKLFQKIAP